MLRETLLQADADGPLRSEEPDIWPLDFVDGRWVLDRAATADLPLGVNLCRTPCREAGILQNCAQWLAILT